MMDAGSEQQPVVDRRAKASGPLQGLRVVEFRSIGPGPFAAMLLSDMGADVVRVDRHDAAPDDPRDFTGRGRRAIALDLKSSEGIAAALQLTEAADVLIEGYRPGVMERLGLGPDVVRSRNPRLVYARMTGWGQDGPLAANAGHDINYIAVTGALAAIGPRGGAPIPPLNLVGDYGGGALYLVTGILAAVLEASRSGQGQIVDCAMCDGVASLMSVFMVLAAQGQWREARGSNLLDGGAPFYTTYRCSDGKYLAVGAIEPKFYSELCRRAGLVDPLFATRDNPATWAELSERAQAIFSTRTRDEWCALLEKGDACVAPVLSLSEAPSHPHLAARGTFTEEDGLIQPAPAPRFSRTPARIQGPPPREFSQVNDVIEDWRAAPHPSYRAVGAP